MRTVLDYRLQKQPANVFECKQSETDITAADVKIHPGFVNIRRKHPNAPFPHFGNIGNDFRHISKLRGQQCRKVFLCKMLLEIGCAIAENSIRRRVTFIECIIGKAGKLCKKLVRKRGINTVCGTAGKKRLPFCGQCGCFFLCHRAAYQVCVTEGISRKVAENLHHLLLINHTSARRAQNRFQLRDFVGDIFRVLTVFNEFWDGFHRSRAIKRNNGNNVVKAIRLHIHQRLPHSAGFQLKNPGGFSRRNQTIGVLIVQRNFLNIKLRVRFLNLHFRVTNDCQVPQTEKIKFQKPEMRYGIHIILGNHRAVALRQRQVFGQRLFGNYNACGVDGDIPRHSLQSH